MFCDLWLVVDYEIQEIKSNEILEAFLGNDADIKAWTKKPSKLLHTPGKQTTGDTDVRETQVILLGGGFMEAVDVHLGKL